MPLTERLDERDDNGLRMEDAFAEAEASLRHEGMNADSHVYRAVKERLLAGEISFDEAVEVIMSQKPAQESNE